MTLSAITRRVTKVNADNRTFTEHSFFDEVSDMEKEVNLFVAELLIDDNDVLELFEQGRTEGEISVELCVPIELLEFKWRIMRHYNKSLPKLSFRATSDFLGKIEIPENYDNCEC